MAATSLILTSTAQDCSIPGEPGARPRLSKRDRDGAFPVRTFWEKATLIHVECHRRQLASRPERLSRHWYDLSCLARHDTGHAALADRALLEDVVRHKKVFFNASYANYDQCLTGQLRLVPDTDQLPALRSDYDAMHTAGIVRGDAPDFDSLIDQIRSVEATVNSSHR